MDTMALVQEKKKFFCREWAFQKLSHCLDQRPISKACGALILGGPGSGKTTFCAELVWPTQGPSGRQQRALNRRLLGYHFLVGQNEHSLLLSEFLRNLVGQILSYSTEGLKQKSIRRREKLVKCTSFEASSFVGPNKIHDDITEENTERKCLNITDEPSTSQCSNDLASLNLNDLNDDQMTGRKLLKRSISGENSPIGSSSQIQPMIPARPISPRTLVADAYYEKLLNDDEIHQALNPDNIEKNPDDCLKRALLFPLLEIDPPKQCLFFIIDSIDEVAFTDTNSTLTKQRTKDRCKTSRTIAELLSNHHHLFPQWLLLVCTARKQSKSISKMFTGFRKLSLDDLRKSQVVRDVQQYILARLDQENSLRQHISRDTAEMLNQLHIKSNGCFLYLEKVLDGVSENFIILREIKEIPGTLNGLYLWLCQRLFNRKQFFKVKPLLNVILAAKCPITKDLLYDIVRTQQWNMTMEDFNKRFHLTRKILNISKKGFISFFHHSFAEWLLDIKHCTQKYLCNIYEGHIMLTMFFYLNGKKLSKSDIHIFAFHLTKVEYYLNQKSPWNESAVRNANVQYVNITELRNEVNGKLEENTIQTDQQLCKNNDEISSTVKINFNDSLPSTNTAKPPLPPKQKVDICQLNSVIKNVDDLHTLMLLWLITSGAEVDTCLFEDTTDQDFNFECHLPRDPKVIKLLLNAGAKYQEIETHTDDDDLQRCSSQVSHSTSQSEQSPVDPFYELISGNGISLSQHDCTGKTLLHCLAAEGNAALLALALQASTEPVNLEASESGHGQTALNVAASHGHTEVVQILLTAGADVNHADADGWTALRAAAWGGHVEVVEALLKHGCSVDCIDADHRTALRAAAWSGHEEIVKLLIQHGADVNKTDLEGRTALIAAAYMGHSEIVEHLLDSGASIDHADMDGRTALSVAALCVPSNHGYAKVVSVLLERGAEVDHQDKDGMTPLLVASFEGHKDVCELLLEYEADVDHADSTGRTPLWAAASMGHASVVGLLLFWGCCVDTIEPAGRTVLSMAAAQGCIEVVRQLLDRGLDEQHRDNAGWTPLHYASFEGHKDVCEALLEAGAKIDEIDNDGKCALMLAAQEGHTDLVELFLVQYGANPNQHSHDGKTALRLAALEGHYDVVRLLIAHGADVNFKDADGRSTLYVLALDNRLPMARYLIEHGQADVESRDSEGRTPLHVSCWQGHYDMVSLLLTTGGADVNACDAEQRSALHSASWQGHADIVRLLLEHGATPDHACNQGATALGISGQQGHEQCVLALLQHGADPTVSDVCGRNALRVAHKSGHLGVVRLLQEYASKTNIGGVIPSSGVGGVGGSASTGISLSTPLTPSASHHTTTSTTGVGNSGSNTSVTSGSTAETKPSCAVLYPVEWGVSECNTGVGGVSGTNVSGQQRRSCVSLGNHSSNSKSSSNLTGSSHSSRHGGDKNIREANSTPVQQPLSFTQQLQQCSRASKNRPASGSGGGSSGLVNMYQLSSQHKSNITSSSADTHFARDTHMRIILGNSNLGVGNRNIKNSLSPAQDSGSNNISGGSSSNSKPRRNGIVTNPAMRLVAGVRNGFDSAAANLRKSTTSSNPATKTHSFQWRKETPL
ncbi:ankyrin repeat domain-containing protein 50 isoform X2 [Chrysoperla carnea]|uniref:ankyrin repeat domain-containing protein 50 isoform X2 n=1 Tax=Chrysoperla carnea TaxID=189513 RepID=UPI001D08C59C|nr:ankyrin repeat domain-containing protein 50 isoform X2 [Chrysoperla carnea]